MRIRMFIWALLLALAVAAAGCGGDSADAPAPAASDDVVLVAAGTDPQPLRLRLAEGAVYRALMTTRITLSQSIDGQVQQMPAQPGQAITIEATITDVTDGVATLDFRYPSVRLIDTAGVDAALLEQLEPVMRSVAGISGTVQMNERGVVLEGALEGVDDLPEAIRPTMQQLTDQLKTLSVPFPEAPVGVGGSWRGTFSVDVGGVRTATTYTYTLRGRTGDRLDIDADAVSRATRGSSDPVIPGIAITAAEGGSRITGGNVTELSNPFPVSSSVRLDGAVTTRIEADGRTANVVTGTAGTISLERVER